MRFHCLFLAPWIVLAIPSEVFDGFGVLLLSLVVAIGLVGVLARSRPVSALASVGLLALLVVGKIGIDLAKVSAPDTAVFLTQFVAVIFFMEASQVMLSFDKETSELGGRTDTMSMAIRERAQAWARGQLTRQAQLVIAALALSLVLLVLGSFASVSVNQLNFSAILVLLVVGVLLFLITQRREPQTRNDLPSQPKKPFAMVHTLQRLRSFEKALWKMHIRTMNRLETL